MDRAKTKEFMTNEKNIGINKDNQILLNKLVEISSGKWSSVVTAPRRQNKVRNQSVKVGNGPKSLNMIVRKKETERIERENHAFAKRLFDKQAILNKKMLDKEFHNHVKFKKQIAKMPPPVKSRMILTSDVRRSDPNLGQAVRYVEEIREPVNEEPAVEQEENTVV